MRYALHICPLGALRALRHGIKPHPQSLLRPLHGFQCRRATHSSAAPPPPSRAARALLLLAAAAPLTAISLIVAGTSYGKVYRPEDAPRFLLRAASLDPATLRALRDEALRVVAAGACARYNFPPGKAGSAVSYAELRRQSPQLCAFYEGMAATVSDLLGAHAARGQLEPVPAAVRCGGRPH